MDAPTDGPMDSVSSDWSDDESESGMGETGSEPGDGAEPEPGGGEPGGGDPGGGEPGGGEPDGAEPDGAEPDGGDRYRLHVHQITHEDVETCKGKIMAEGDLTMADLDLSPHRGIAYMDQFNFITQVFALIAIEAVIMQHKKTLAVPCGDEDDPGLPSPRTWMELVLNDDYGDQNPNRAYLHGTADRLAQMAAWMINNAQQMPASVIEQVPLVKEAYERLLSMFVNTEADIDVDDEGSNKGSDDEDNFINDSVDDDDEIVVQEEDREWVLSVAKSVWGLLEKIEGKGPRRQLTDLCDAIRDLGESPHDSTARGKVQKAVDLMPSDCVFARTAVNDWLASLS